jgi:hypothetical protein
MSLKLAICLLPLILAVWSASLLNLDCNTVCADPHRHDESEAVHCGCHNPHSKFFSSSFSLLFVYVILEHL